MSQFEQKNANTASKKPQRNDKAAAPLGANYFWGCEAMLTSKENSLVSIDSQKSHKVYNYVYNRF